MKPDPYAFVMSFIAASDKYRRQYIDTWKEILANFTVKPSWDQVDTYRSPYRQGTTRNNAYNPYNKSARSPRDQIILKDPETHKIVMTYASKLVRTLFGDRDKGFVKARPIGVEDAVSKAPTVSKLLEYAFSRPGAFRTMVESIVDMILFGTSVVEVNWHYEEREMPVREVEQDMGVDLSQEYRVRIPVYDDVRITPLDVFDFYPDPSRYRIQDMSGAAKRFRMTAMEARSMAESGIYDATAVDQAINENGGSSTEIQNKDSLREGVDQPTERKAPDEFKEMIGYEYWGVVPWADENGSSRRVITILNSKVVRNDPWPLADPHLPFHTFIINPIQGRFYGVSPAEVVLYQQDFSDAILILLAEAIVRQVHPPIAYEADSEIDVAKVKAWKADALIPVKGGPNAIGTLRYDANVANGFAMLAGLKGSMQEASGALGAIQGEAGPSREPATAAAFRYQSAMDRPELAAMVIEQECLPPIGCAILRRYQQFLDYEGLVERVGENPQPEWIGDIMGDYDIDFVGSRNDVSPQEKMQGIDRLVALASAVPPLQALIPWAEIAPAIVSDLLRLPEVAARMQQLNPEMVLANMLMSGGLGGAGRGGPADNGVAPSSEPSGLLPSQVAGNVSE